MPGVPRHGLYHLLRRFRGRRLLVPLLHVWAGELRRLRREPGVLQWEKASTKVSAVQEQHATAQEARVARCHGAISNQDVDDQKQREGGLQWECHRTQVAIDQILCGIVALHAVIHRSSLHYFLIWSF